MSEIRLPPIRLSHLGICVLDLPAMEAFYVNVLGFSVTDRGSTLGFDLVFMSRDPNDHHQIVLSTGRPRDLPINTVNPMFGPVINQISFALESLGQLKTMVQYLRATYPAELLIGNHGTAWSVYFDDPEGNKIEVFVDSDWYVPQPVFEPFDIDRPEAEILADTERMCRAFPGFMLASEWRRQVSPRIAEARERIAP
jgi:catechol 2,3-dioxygenase